MPRAVRAACPRAPRTAGPRALSSASTTRGTTRSASAPTGPRRRRRPAPPCEACERAGPRRRARTGPAHRAGKLTAHLGARGVEQEPQPRVALAWAPDSQRHPTAQALTPRAISTAALAGSAANISPSRQSTASKEAEGSAMSSRSRSRVRTLVSPLDAARRAAMRVIAGTTSVSTTSPRGPTSGAAASPVPPGPQASSSTRSPGRSAARASRAAVTSARDASSSSAWISHRSATEAHIEWSRARCRASPPGSVAVAVPCRRDSFCRRGSPQVGGPRPAADP